MPDQIIRLPDTSGGKSVHSQELTVDISGTPTVVQHEYIIPTSARVVSGVYVAHTTAYTISATADTFPAGRWFLINPVGSTLKVALRHVYLASQMGAAAIRASSPRLLVVAFTFTGTASGTVMSPRKAQTTMANSTGSLRTASTGLTLTRTQDITAFLPWASLSAVDGSPPSETSYCPPEDEQVVLAAGEGVMLTQADAGTASDNRRYIANVTWSEFTTP